MHDNTRPLIRVCKCDVRRKVVHTIFFEHNQVNVLKLKDRNKITTARAHRQVSRNRLIQRIELTYITSM